MDHKMLYLITNIMVNKLPLNEYYYRFNQDINNHFNGYCNKCLISNNIQALENINHVLYECPYNEPNRLILKANLIKINNIFNNNNNFQQISNIIFPFKNPQINPDDTLNIWFYLYKYFIKTNPDIFR